MKQLKICCGLTFCLAVLTMTLILSGCSLIQFDRENVPVVDKVALEYKLWKKHIADGDLALQGDRLDEALNSYLQAVEIKPETSDVHVKIAQIYFRQKKHEKAISAFKTGLLYDASNNEARNYLGYLYEQIGEDEKAAHEYELVLKSSPKNLYALNHLGLMFFKLDRLDEAEAILRKALKIDPDCERSDNKDVHNYLGLIYEKRGDVGEAIAEYRESIRLNPDATWAQQHLGSLYEDLGRYYEAQLIYLKLLEIDPDNLFAASRLEAIESLNYPQVITEIEPVELIEDDIDAIIASAPSREEYPEDDAVILLDKFSHEVLENSSSRYTTHQIVKILTERGIKRYGDVAIAFHSQSQNIGVNIARTILPDGTEIEPPDEAFNDVTSPGLLEYNLFSDLMWKVVAMPALEPGVIIEYKVTVEDVLSRTNDQGGDISAAWFWGDMSFQSTDPTLRSKCALRLPTEMKFNWKVYQCQIEPTISVDEQKMTYVWDYGKSEALEVEPNMPSLKEFIPRLSYSSVELWEEVQDWYRDLARGQYDIDAAIENKVKELIGDAKNEEEKIRAIYDFVATKIRYVGIEFGQGAYQPSSAMQVFRHRYGDCKDKVTLMIAMLEVAQITAYPAMINPAPYAKINVDLPSPSQFAHLICAVPKGLHSPAECMHKCIHNFRHQGEWIRLGGCIVVDALTRNTQHETRIMHQSASDYFWLDPTVETCSYDTLPYHNQGRQALVITESDGFFITIPIDPPEKNKLSMSTALKIDQDGTMSGVERITATGQFAIDYKFLYKSIKPNDLVDFFQMTLNEKYMGVEVHDVSLSGIEELDDSFETTVKFSVKHYGSISGNPEDMNLPLLIPIPDDNFSDQAIVVAQQNRRYKLEIGYPTCLEKVVTIDVPEGYVLSDPHQSVELTFDFGKFSRRCTLEGQTVKYNMNYTINVPAISPTKYHQFKRLIEAISREDKIQLVYKQNRSINWE